MTAFTYIYNGFILIFAIYVFHGLWSCSIEFKKILDNFNNGSIVEKRTVKLNNEQSINFDDNSVVRRTHLAEDVNYHIIELERNKNSFFEQYAKYVMHSQYISLFPFFGILGTVWGLFSSASANAIGELIAGLSTALSTTIVGLFASIILKYFDSTYPGKRVNEIEAKFEIADSTIQMKTLTEELRATSMAIQSQNRNSNEVNR